ncbi:hypothetical protein MACH05_06460 [Qipengyuania nanhaisediminis]
MKMDPPPKVPEAKADSRAQQARSDLFAQISEFMIRHDLDITGTNLSAVGTALSGANAALAKAFAARELSGDPVDQRWINTVIRLDPETGERISELDVLMDKMEYAMMRFAATARAAATETLEQRGALDATIQKISDPGAEVFQVIALSKAMLERIEGIEKAMERSQAESDALRADLAKARIEADIDHLTRLPNRRAFERRLDAATRDAVREGTPLCVAFCDVDHFKAINDTHGHDVGDRVLVAIAGTLNRSANDECFVARHGGEEFAVLLFGFDKETAWRKLDAIRREQARKRMVNRESGKPFGKVTFSGGIAEIAGPDDARTALRRADEALYAAKQQGRNRIVAH